MGEELSADVDVSQQHDPDVFLVDLEELEKLRNHVFTVKGQRQQALFIATTTTGICAHRRIKEEKHEQQALIVSYFYTWQIQYIFNL